GADSSARTVRALRRALPGRPLGSLSRRPSTEALRRSRSLGFDFHQSSPAPGQPSAAEVLAHIGATRPRRAAPAALERGTVTKRLSILTDIVKTANSILEPRKLIELIMAKIQQLIPSEAWSILMVDEETQELTFELAIGEKAKDVSGFRVRIGEGIAGW